MAEDAAGGAWESGSQVRIRRPAWLQRVDVPGGDADLVLAHQPSDPSTFRMNLVVTTGRAPGDIATAGALAVAGALASSPATHVIACDLVPDHPLGAGRRLEFVSPAPGGHA